MRHVLGKELSLYFKTPVGYVFLCMYTLISGVMFAFVNLDRYGSASPSMLLSATRLPFLLIAPLLTMRLLAEERRQKTDQLLLTSPLSLRAVVLGKFFAALLVALLGMLLTASYFLLISRFAEVYAGVVLSNYLGFFLMSACTIAIGVLMSALCESQLSACVMTLGFNLLLYLCEQYVLPQLGAGHLSALYGALRFFAMGARFGAFANGVIPLASIVYFVAFTAAALLLAIRAVDRRRWAGR